MSQHNLKHNGAAYNDNAELINSDPKVTSGAGRALCTCGWISGELANGAQRRAAHKDHKAAAAQLEATMPEVEPGTPEDEVAEALAELVEPAPKFDTPAERKAHLQAFGKEAPTPAPKAKAKAKAKAPRATRQTARAGLLEEHKAKAAAAPKAPKATTPKPAAGDGTTLVLPFTTAITPGFWRSLGRDGAAAMVGRMFPTVTVVPNNNARTLALQGPAADVAKAAATIQAMWADALLAVKEWKKTDAGFIGRSTERLARRQEGYHLTEAFFVQYGASYGA